MHLFLRLWSNQALLHWQAFPVSHSPVHADPVVEQIRRCGARATPARIRVLQLLRTMPGALTHNQIELALGESALDRVTLYRVLDWLVESGLAHKSADANRVFRFSVAAESEHAAHVHFRCDHCGKVFCLDQAPPSPPAMPAGFSLARADFDLHGSCASCGADEPSSMPNESVGER
ncbi:MAG: transcriptional repressor [Propionivibrio sp.]